MVVRNWTVVVAYALLVLVVGTTVQAKRRGGKNNFKGKNFSLVKRLSPFALGWTASSHCSDVWGYTDDRTGRRYAIPLCEEGSSLVDITEPEKPVVVGKLFGHNKGKYVWRDVKVYKHYAFFVSEAFQSELQILDLHAAIDGKAAQGRRLLDLVEDKTLVKRTRKLAAKKKFRMNNKVKQLKETGVYDGTATKHASNAHNLIINEDSGYAYLVGGSTGCFGGLHIVDIRNPMNPKFSACFNSVGDSYIHDAQCVSYKTGQYAGKDICFAFSPYVVMTIDVTNHKNPTLMDKFHYDSTGYVHQGWLTTDRKFLLVDDELDNHKSPEGYRTFVVDVRDLTKLRLAHIHVARGKLFGDHNQYVKNIDGGDIDYTYQSNYAGGLRALRINRGPVPGLGSDEILGLEEVGYFDTFKDSNSPIFNGAWSNYAFFDPIHIVVDQKYGMFIVKREFDDNTKALGGNTPTQQPTIWVNCKAKTSKDSCNANKNNCVWDYDWIQGRGWKPACYTLPGSIKPQKDSNGEYRGPNGGGCSKLSKTQCNMYPKCWSKGRSCTTAPF